MTGSAPGTARQAWLLLLVTASLGFVAVEAGLRLRAGAPLLTLQDWRGQNVTILQTGGALYDAELGWVQRPHFASDGFNTLDFGIRKNSASSETLAPGAILAVGDSFTAGSDVTDEETWPALLERQLGTRVINAGVGGYGVDQAVLNAERLLPVLRPRAVVVGIYEDDILRSTYRTYTAPKPYFVEENGAWVLKNRPVPHAPEAVPEPTYRLVLSRLMLAHLVAQRYATDWWQSVGARRFERSTAEPSRVACYVLERLHGRLKAEGIPGIVVVQYSGWSYWRGREREPDTQLVLNCARRIGYTVVDEHDHMSSIARRSTAELKRHYVMSGDNFGHMSRLGNGLIASLLAPKLREIDMANSGR